MNFYRNSVFFIMIASFSHVIFAGNLVTLLNDNPYTLGVDLGVGHPTNLGNSTQFKLGYSTFIYHPRDHNTWPFYGGIALNKNFINIDPYQFQLGLSYHYFSPMRINGDLAQGITPPHYLANYSYAIHSSQFLIEAIVRQHWCRFSPYLFLGLGVAFNQAQNFSTNIPPYLTLTPFYSNSTTGSFSYALGLGVDYLIDPKLTMGIGYRFVDLGTAGLGTGAIRYTQISEKLSQSHLYVNVLTLHFNYFI